MEYCFAYPLGEHSEVFDDNDDEYEGDSDDVGWR